MSGSLKYFFTTVCLILLIACSKDDSFDSCKGCAIDTSPKEFEFSISGHIYANCELEPASHRMLEFYWDNSFLGEIETDIQGDFVFTYTVVLNWPHYTYNSYPLYTPPPTLMKIPLDSTEFVLPGLLTIEGLELTLNDSIHLEIFLGESVEPLSESDTLYYSFDAYKLFEDYTHFDYKAAGPIQNNALINEVHEKWNRIQIDEYGDPMLNTRWRVKRSNDPNSPKTYYSTTSVPFCTMNNVPVVL